MKPIKISEQKIYHYKENNRYADIYFKNNEFDHCNFGGLHGDYNLEDWIFLKSLGEEIIRLSVQHGKI